MVEFPAKLQHVSQQLDIAQSAAGQVRGSATLTRVLGVLLKMGNQMNKHTRKGQAQGTEHTRACTRRTHT